MKNENLKKVLSLGLCFSLVGGFAIGFYSQPVKAAPPIDKGVLAGINDTVFGNSGDLEAAFSLINAKDRGEVKMPRTCVSRILAREAEWIQKKEEEKRAAEARAAEAKARAEARHADILKQLKNRTMKPAQQQLEQQPK